MDVQDMTSAIFREAFINHGCVFHQTCDRRSSGS